MSATAKIEFGDFQTPEELAREVCALLLRQAVEADLVVEPSRSTDFNHVVNLQLENNTALVTGSTKGIGFAIARLLSGKAFYVKLANLAKKI
jgi:hypothetical protein